VATQVLPWQVVAVAFAGQATQLPPHAAKPAAHVAATQEVPEQVKPMALAVGQAAQPAPQSR
jgi:hypothetical protein